jgi:hypothetical protein
MRFGVGFRHSTSSLLHRLGPSVLRRPAGQSLSLGSSGLLLVGVLAVFVRVAVVFQYLLALVRRFASVARCTGNSFVAASVWAARPGASGSPAGSLQQFLGALPVGGVFASRRKVFPQLAAWGSTVVGGGLLSAVLGLVRSGRHRQNRVAMVGANPSFNRTGNGWRRCLPSLALGAG